MGEGVKGEGEGGDEGRGGDEGGGGGEEEAMRNFYYQP